MGVRPLHALAGLMCAVGATGCAGGFTPMYAVPGVQQGLSNIEVVGPSGRTAYLIRESLDDALARDLNAKPVYRLTYTVKQTRVPRGLRVDNIANRYEVQTLVSYRLVSLADRKELTKGQVAVNLTADSADQPYAGIAAQLDADERSAAEAAQRIRNALGGYFANPTAVKADLGADKPTPGDFNASPMNGRMSPQDTTRDPDVETGVEQPPARVVAAPAAADGIERIQ